MYDFTSRCGARVVCLRPTGFVVDILLVRAVGGKKVLQKDGSFYLTESRWQMPGGTCEDGEGPKDAIRREFPEETGHKFPEHLLKKKKHQMDFEVPSKRSEGTYVERVYLVIAHNPDDIRIDESFHDESGEIDCVQWFPLEGIPINKDPDVVSISHNQLRELVDMLRKNRRILNSLGAREQVGLLMERVSEQEYNFV